MKIQRPEKNILPPAYASVGTERTTFGTTEQSDDLADNLNENLYRGWGIVGPNDYPPKQWFNALLYTFGALITHIYQNGIPEWSASQDYYIGSISLWDGKMYVSLTGTETSPNRNRQPDTSSADWKSTAQVPYATELVAGVVTKATSAEVTEGIDNEKYLTPLSVKSAVPTVAEATIAVAGIARLATVQMALDGVDDTTIMTPALVKLAFDEFIQNYTPPTDPVPDAPILGATSANGQAVTIAWS